MSHKRNWWIRLTPCLPRSIELLNLEQEWCQASCKHDKHAEPFSLALLFNCCCCCRAFLRASRMGSPSPLLWMCETLHRLIFRLLSLQKPMARGILSPTQTLCPTAQSLLSWRSASLASSSRMLSRRKASQFWTTPRSAWKLAAVVIVTLCSCCDYHTSCVVTVVKCLTSVVIHHCLHLRVACHKRCLMCGGDGGIIGGHHVTAVRLCSAGSEAAGYQHHPLPRYHYWYGYHPDPERYCQAPKEVKPCFKLVHE